MKHHSLFIPLVFSLIIFTACSGHKTDKNKSTSSGGTYFVTFRTTMGDIKLKLYNETPLHRDNFVRLAKEGYYNGLLFHRVIKNFMIQAGDPDSRHAHKGQLLGNGGPGYTIPAEIRPDLFHKKGALAAARMGDRVNPEKASSGSQFYIVQGKTFSDQELDQIEKRIDQTNQNAIFYYFKKQVTNEMKSTSQQFDQQKIMQEAQIRTADSLEHYKPFHFTDTQRKIYKTIGGAPHLDGNYTVFGEVVSGMDIVDKIASVATDNNDRPLEDIRIISTKVTSK